jgi:signal transduction histidine kinase
MKMILPKTEPNIRLDLFKTYPQGLKLFQLCIYGIILMVVVIFIIYYPANLPEWRFFGTEIALVSLLVLNIFGIKTNPSASLNRRLFQDWAFLIISALLVLATVWMSAQFDLVYLLSIVCVQADFKRGVWPAGVIFSAANLLAWLGIQIATGASFPAIVGRESSLAVGVVFGAIVVTLINRFAQQTERAESLLKELQRANIELAAAQQKEKDLAIAEERIRLARELHDSVTQLLYSVTLYAEAAAELLDSGETETAAGHLRDIRDTAQEALREMRLLIFELRRPALEKSGLATALQARLDAVETRGGMHAELQVVGTENLPAAVQAELYNITQEALNNALKHAHAKNVRIRLQFEGDATDVEVIDDGVGFEPAIEQSGGGFGISGMKERAQKIGGTIQIESAPGKGTKVSLRVQVSTPRDADRTKQELTLGKAER